jgi:cellulose synthase/poly-beta-1,6-N-acetylglucosamine synthase-like glycosyltransferase
MEANRSVKRPPRVVIGVPLYNGAEHLEEALESLLAQRYPDYAVLLVDDCSSDDTPAIAQRYLHGRGVLTYHRNPKRLGMIGRYRRCYEIASELYPGFEYFAWGSDHDVWHPRWLSQMVRALDGNGGVVLTYPLNVGISDEGAVVREVWEFDTLGIRRRGRRLRRVVRGISAGNMVYGLYRAKALERAGIYRRVLLPDRLLMAELSQFGQFEQVPEILWYRRFRPGVQASLERQRSSFFPDGAPAYSHLPWWLVHSVAMGWSLVRQGQGLPDIGRARGAWTTLRYLRLSAVFQAGRRTRRVRLRTRRRARLAAKHGRKWVLRRASVGVAPKPSSAAGRRSPAGARTDARPNGGEPSSTARAASEASPVP